MVRLMEIRQSSRTAFQEEKPASAKALRQLFRQKRRSICLEHGK